MIRKLILFHYNTVIYSFEILYSYSHHNNQKKFIGLPLCMTHFTKRWLRGHVRERGLYTMGAPQTLISVDDMKGGGLGHLLKPVKTFTFQYQCDQSSSLLVLILVTIWSPKEIRG